MDRNKVIFGFTLLFSVVLEWWVRHGTILAYGVNGFSLWPHIDNVMHFMWGFNIFLIFLLFFKWEPIDALLAVFVWQMAWECMEIIGDTIIQQPDYMFDHFFYDGIKDTVVDAAGALLGWRLFAWDKKDKQPRKFRAFMVNYLYAIIALVVVGSIYLMWTVHAGGSFRSPNLFAVSWIILSAILLGLFEFFRRR